MQTNQHADGHESHRPHPTRPVQFMNADWAPGGRQPQTKPVDLGCESAENWQLPSTSTVATVIITQPVSWYSFDRRMEGWVDLGTAVKVHSPYPRLHIAAAVAINTTVRIRIPPGIWLTSPLPKKDSRGREGGVRPSVPRALVDRISSNLARRRREMTYRSHQNEALAAPKRGNQQLMMGIVGVTEGGDLIPAAASRRGVESTVRRFVRLLWCTKGRFDSYTRKGRVAAPQPRSSWAEAKGCFKCFNHRLRIKYLDV